MTQTAGFRLAAEHRRHRRRAFETAREEDLTQGWNISVVTWLAKLTGHWGVIAFKRGTLSNQPPNNPDNPLRSHLKQILGFLC